MKIRHTASLTLNSGTTFAGLRAQLTEAAIPDTARITVEQYKGDQREPGYTTIIFSWET